MSGDPPMYGNRSLGLLFLFSGLRKKGSAGDYICKYQRGHYKGVTECTSKSLFNKTKIKGFSEVYAFVSVLVSFQFLLTPSHGLVVVRWALWYKIASNSFMWRLSGGAGGRLDSCSQMWEIFKLNKVLLCKTWWFSSILSSTITRV